MDVSAPFEIDGIFHSLRMDDLRGFDEIKRISREIATVPADFDPQYFAQKGPEYDAGRAEVAALPDTAAMMRREAEDAMAKRTPTLLRKLGEEPEVKADTGDGWTRKAGHIGFTSEERSAALEAAVGALFGEHCFESGDFLYPANGYRLWHTNRYDTPGWRMYLVQVDAPGESYFRFIHPETGEIVTVWDAPDTVNFFPIHADDDLWHCIVSETTNRWSQGFVVPETWSDILR